MSARRVDWVDAAKGLCIVFVVMMHSTLGVEKAMGETGWLGAVVAFAQPFRMPDFFLISGLFLARVVDRDWRTFLDRRVVHFLYFYVLWLTIQFAFKAPGLADELGAAGLVRFYLTSLLVEPFGTLWFIWILPVFALAIRLTRRVPVPVMAGIAAALEIAPIHTGLTILDEGASRFVYFYAGYAFAPLVFAFAARVAEARVWAITGIAAWALVNGVVVFSGASALPVVSLILGTAGAAAIVAVAVLVATSPAGDIVRALGSRSIVVYLAFFLPMAVSRSLLIGSGLDVGTVSALVTVAGVLAPFAIHAVAIRCGGRFLFERPSWAHLDRTSGRSGALLPA